MALVRLTSVSIDPHAFRTRAYRELAARLSSILGGEAKLLEPLGVTTLFDLMLHVPRRYYSGTEMTDLGALVKGDEVAVVARIARAKRIFSTSEKAPQRLEVVITDDKAYLPITFFGRGDSNPKAKGRVNATMSYWERLLQPGRRGIFAGKVGEFRGDPQLTHPSFVVFDENGEMRGSQSSLTMGQVARGDLIGLYPATAKYQTWQVAHAAMMVLDHLSGLDDPLAAPIRAAADVPDLLTAFSDVHRPSGRESVEVAMRRLLFDEVFSLQLAMARRRAIAAEHPATPRPRRSGGLLDAFDAQLPFTLTAGQEAVSAQLFDEIARPRPMQRLLQGEVGSGKTLVALRQMLAVIDNGGQAALLAPTEVLAGQHRQSITKLLGELADGGTLTGTEHATRVVLLTGSLPAARKRAVRAEIASGEAGIVIGTHALLSDSVTFADLGLVVVDEQHRFGVEQRAALSARTATRPHLLAMTATPIPRSVAMTFFGDLEPAILTELPAGRAPVSTVVVSERVQPAWVDRAWQRIVEEAAAGRQAFVVCSRIDPSDPAEPAAGRTAQPTFDDDLPAPLGVVELFEDLRTGPLAALRVGMLHGRLPTEEKDATMAAFAAGELDVLVATTVIEVGVDVPNASVMVIKDADRFGISQLHQLRGRIGRGAHPGVCLLLSHTSPLSPSAQRLAAVAATTDGFRLAEVDLAQRKEGDILGASQSGVRSSLRFLRVLEHTELIEQAHDLAARCLAADPELTDPGLADLVTLVESQAAADWLERG